MNQTNEGINNAATPTLVTYNEWQAAYNYFNEELFAGKLPECIITLNRSARLSGYFYPDKYNNKKGGIKDELSMNPKYISNKNIFEALSTLVHEMCHVWQRHYGVNGFPGKYHNKEWGTEMKRIGLMPSRTGKPGGAETGSSMLDYVIEGGMFEKVCKQFISKGFLISWTEVGAIPVCKGIDEVKEKSIKRRRYSCMSCEAEVWGIPGLKITCDLCKSSFVLS